MVHARIESRLTPQVEIAVAVIRRGDRVLVTRRGEGQHLAGCDEFPGGHRRPNESLEDCLRREVREETGHAVRIRELLATKRHFYPDRITWLWFYLCEPLAPEDPTAATAQDARWVRIPELVGLRWPPANLRIVERLVTRHGPHRRPDPERGDRGLA